MENPSQRGRRQAFLALALIAGLGSLLLACSMALCAAGLAATTRRPSTDPSPLMLLSGAAGAAFLALPLAWTALRGLQGKGSTRFALPIASGLALVLMYGLALAGGQSVLQIRQAPAIVLAPFHIAALTIPPILLFWLVARLVRDPGFTWRQAWGGLGGGAFGAVGLALMIELALLILAGVIVFSLISSTPEGARILSELQNGGGLSDAEMTRLLSNPLVLAALLIGLSGIVPIIEEIAKSILPAVAGALTQRSVARLFLWGVASGAGFAMIEGVLNGAVNVQDWGAVALLRIGSSAMHCLGAGLTGWGWGEAWAHKRWLRLIGAYAAAIAVHGIWNAISVGMLAGSSMSSWVSMPAVLLLVLLTSGAILALLVMASRLRITPAPQGESGAVGAGPALPAPMDEAASWPAASDQQVEPEAMPDAPTPGAENEP